MTDIRHAVKSGLLLFLVLFVITGFVYSLAVTLIAGTAFPYQAHGSLIIGDQGRVIGSSLIGQNFSAPFYFQSRPSATPVTAYNASSSGGSNLAPINPLLLEQIAERVSVHWFSPRRRARRSRSQGSMSTSSRSIVHWTVWMGGGDDSG